MPRSLTDRAWHVGLRSAYLLRLAWWRVRKPVLRGAFVAVWHEGRVLVIRNSYRRVPGLPGGGVGWRETPRDAGARELREEVGIATERDALVHRGEFVEVTPYAEDHIHLFELHCERPPEVRVDGREVVWAAFLSPGEAIDLGVVGTVRDYLDERRSR